MCFNIRIIFRDKAVLKALDYKKIFVDQNTPLKSKSQKVEMTMLASGIKRYRN